MRAAIAVLVWTSMCVGAGAVEPAMSTTVAAGSTVIVLTGTTPSATSAEPTLTISGNRATTLRYQHYAGLPAASSGFFQSGFTRHETTRLKLGGQVLETVKVDGDIFQSDVDFDNQYHLRLATRNYELTLGEFPMTFTDSEFSLVSRPLQGARLTGNVPLGPAGGSRLEFTAVASSPRGQPRYDKFFGQDTQGPYPLGAAPVIVGSEVIRIDKIKQVRNVDYEINYLTGQVTFTRRIVEHRSLVEATYEARQSLYARALDGGQVRYAPTETDVVSVLALDERDHKAADITAASGVPPTAHTVAGLTARHDGEYLRAGGEYAHSINDPDRTLAGVRHGNAWSGSMELERFGALLGGDVKRVEPRYFAPGNAALGQDAFGWSSHGSLALGRAVTFGGRHNQQRSVLNGEPDRMVATDATAAIAPRGMPRTAYRFYQDEETFQASFDRLDRRHAVDVGQTVRHATWGAGYEHQDLAWRDRSQADRVWNAGRLSAGVAGVPWISAALNAEGRRGREEAFLAVPSHGFQTFLGSANLGFTPTRQFFLGGSNQWQKTGGEPARNTLRTEVKANPADIVSTQGSFSQETLQLPLSGVTHAARTDSAAGLLEVRPVHGVSLVYQPSMRRTVLTGVRPPVNSNQRDGYTAKWAAGSVVSLEGGLVQEGFRLRDTATSLLSVLTAQDDRTWSAATRLAPTRAFASEVTYTDRTNRREQALTAVPGGRDERETRQQTIRIGARPQLESRFGLEAGYRFERFMQAGSRGPALALPGFTLSPLAGQVQAFGLQNDYSSLRTHEHETSAGASYQWRRELAGSATLGWDLKQDRLGRLPDVSTLAASGGVTLRVRVVKVDATYRLGQSRGGVSSVQQAVSGTLDVIPASAVHWSTRLEYSVRDHPATALTDLTTSLEMSF